MSWKDDEDIGCVIFIVVWAVLMILMVAFCGDAPMDDFSMPYEGEI